MYTENVNLNIGMKVDTKENAKDCDTNRLHVTKCNIHTIILKKIATCVLVSHFFFIKNKIFFFKFCTFVSCVFYLFLSSRCLKPWIMFRLRPSHSLGIGCLLLVVLDFSQGRLFFFTPFVIDFGSSFVTSKNRLQFCCCSQPHNSFVVGQIRSFFIFTKSCQRVFLFRFGVAVAPTTTS